MDKKKIYRPIRPVDFVQILLDFVQNIIESFLVLFRQLSEIAIYHSGRETEINRAWEEFTTDLEKIQEDNDGNAGFN